MPGPLRYRFRVGCPAERAFQLWTQSADVWWPMATHSVSGRRDAALVIEPGPGGRIYEQTASGQQFSWGTVVTWEPPRRLVCEWLVGDTPTELEVRFAPDADGGTLVELEHRGWERFSIASVAEGMSSRWAELTGTQLKRPDEEDSPTINLPREGST
jgi:uncharacterized protein YndB with AHSA1/START domain